VAVDDVAQVEGPEDRAFQELLEKIAQESGFRCASYKERCLRRRIAVRLRARGVHAFADYARLLDGDPHEWERLLDALTINVTKLFRDPTAFEALARTVVPALWRLDVPTVDVWSAGCASGEEAYSLAALFHRHAEQLGQAHRATRVRVLGSDIDRASLAAAELGCYGEPAFADTPPDLRARYFAAAPGCAADELRAMVRWERRDLLHELPPAGPLHLIVCRNVRIYFDRQSQEELFARFRAALAPGGFLVLGKVETLLGDARAGFEVVQPRERIFRRV
jgi:chemotaxis methyl-accepting protein methylase